MLNKRITITLFFTLLLSAAIAQLRFSVSNDAGLQHNFKQDQRFWTIGHTTQLQFHLTPKDGVYAIFAYYARGKYNNTVTATAKSATTVPQQVNYLNSARMRLKQFSLGYKKYLRGTPDGGPGWNLYGFAGFGLMLGKVDNAQNPVLDTVVYSMPVRSGLGKFKRLTMELGAGWEILLGGDIYFYTETKVWLPTTDYPSKYLLVNNNAPFVAMLGAGIRVIF